MSIESRPVLASCLAASLAFCAAAADGYSHKVPEGFKPFDKVIAIDASAAGSAGPATIDLGWGASAGQCPTGAWSGTVRFVGHAGGDIEYTGQMYGCFTHGTGTARYPDGSSYTGQVSAYLSGDGARLDTNNVRMAVREGNGQHTRADGTVVTRSFSRGVASDAATAGAKKSGGLFSEIGAAFAQGTAARVEGGAQSLTRQMDAQAASAEGFAQRAEQGAGGAESFVQRAGQEAAGAESFAQRAAQEASGAEAFAAQAGAELGLGGGKKGGGKGGGKGGKNNNKGGGVMGELANVGGFVQQNSNSAPGGPKYNVGGQIDSALGGGGSASGTATTGAACLAGTWRRPICGVPGLKAEVWFSGGPQGQGYVKDADCAAVCPEGRRFDFNYSVSGDGSMQIEYTGGQVCGTPKTPTGGAQAFSCNGSTLKFGNEYKKAQ